MRSDHVFHMTSYKLYDFKKSEKETLYFQKLEEKLSQK